MHPYKPIKTFNVNLFLQDDMDVRVTERVGTPQNGQLVAEAQ
jgi:hypothetical protein